MSLKGKIRLYLFNIKIQLLKLLEFRFDFLLSIILTGVNVIFYAFLWTSIYSGNTSINDLSWGQMIVYSITSNFMTTIFATNVQNYINESVKSGDIVYLMGKPINICGFWLSSDIGNVIKQLVLYTLPLIGLIAFVFIAKINIQFSNILLFLLSSILSYIILWTISFAIGSIAFWHNELGTMGDFKDLIILLLSGSFVPLWFFPEIVQKVSEYLPFQYIYQAPLGILINKYKGEEIIKIILMQLFWIVIFSFVVSFIYKRARNRLVVQGG